MYSVLLLSNNFVHFLTETGVIANEPLRPNHQQKLSQFCIIQYPRFILCLKTPINILHYISAVIETLASCIIFIFGNYTLPYIVTVLLPISLHAQS